MKNNFFLLCMILQVTLNVQSADVSGENVQEASAVQLVELSIKQPDKNDLREMIKGLFVRRDRAVHFQLMCDMHWDNCIVRNLFRLFNKQESWSKIVHDYRRGIAQLKKEGELLCLVSEDTASQLGLDEKELERIYLGVAHELYYSGKLHFREWPLFDVKRRFQK